jgi:diguanylate cyclase (GGDEF)-like protein
MTSLDEATQASAYRRLIRIGMALSAEKDLGSLLEHILQEAKDLANADGGTIYLASGNDSLKFSIVMNDTLGITQGGKSGVPITLPDIPLAADDGSPNMANVASRVANDGQTSIIEDARTNTEFDFTGTRAFDDMLNYRSTSFLTIPLKNLADESIGVLQLLNAQDDNGNVVQFSREVIPIIEALASQASVAIENRALLDEQDALKNQLERDVDSRTNELKDALTKLSEAHIILKELNTIDAVTGIRNRQHFDDVIEQEWRRAMRQEYDISLLILDIDHFKRVNDNYGHIAGDECLAAIAKEIDDLFNRPSDTVARYGGEEFAVILPYVSPDNAFALAEQVRKRIQKKKFSVDHHKISITVSIGIATVTPSDEIAPRDLIGWADGVLYEAKAAGRNNVQQYTNN